VVVAGAGVVDGDPAGELAGDLAGSDLAGVGAAGAGVGADHVSWWRQAFTAEDALSGDLSRVRGARAGFS
jgi:hypothetical protein